jgi:hypothetical protein
MNIRKICDTEGRALALMSSRANAIGTRNRIRALAWLNHKEFTMADLSQIKEHAEVIGADGVHVGTVDGIDGNRIKLTKEGSGQGSHKGHHHYIDGGLVATVDEKTVRLSANADVAVTFELEEDDKR